MSAISFDFHAQVTRVSKSFSVDSCQIKPMTACYWVLRLPISRGFVFSPPSTYLYPPFAKVRLKQFGIEGIGLIRSSSLLTRSWYHSFQSATTNMMKHIVINEEQINDVTVMGSVVRESSVLKLRNVEHQLTEDVASLIRVRHRFSGSSDTALPRNADEVSQNLVSDTKCSCRSRRKCHRTC